MSLTEEQLGGFLRQRGLYRATLDEWRESMLRGARAELDGRAAKTAKTKTAKTKTKTDRAADAKRIRQLERELTRKEKTLAEAAALLVLQKKCGPSWGARTTTSSRRADGDPGSAGQGRRGGREAQASMRPARSVDTDRPALARHGRRRGPSPGPEEHPPTSRCSRASSLAVFPLGVRSCWTTRL